MKDYKGTIIEESLEDNRILNNFEIVEIKISNDEQPENRWHLYTVNVSRENIDKLSEYIKSGTWYMHFWKGREIIVVFKNKIFQFNYDNKDSWRDAVEYGLSVGIPLEQLDFVIEE